MTPQPQSGRWLGALAVIGCAALATAAEMAVTEASLEQAFARLRTYDWGQSRAALGPIDEAINAFANNNTRRRQLEQRLATVLATDAPVAAKSFACERLSRVGSAEAIPALAVLLPSPELSHMARFALVRIAGPRASDALRRALPAVEGQLKIGIINSLGQLEDPNAVEPLKGLLHSTNVAIAAASASALGRIATVESARLLGESRAAVPREFEPALTAAWLLAAERLTERGQRDEGTSIFRLLFRPESPVAVRLAAFRGLVTAEPARAAELLSSSLAGSDDQMRSLAARILADAPTAPPLTNFLAPFKSYPPASQVAVLDALRRRQETAGRPTAREALESPELAVRLAALRALAVIGVASDVPLLARACASSREEEKAAARAALAALPGQDANQVILTELATASPDVNVELIRALTLRHAEGANAYLVARLTDSNERVQVAALDALATLGGSAEISPLVRFLNAATGDTAREQAEQTLSAIARRNGSAAAADLIVGLNSGGTDSQVVLLRVLGIVGGPRALEAIRVIVGQPNSPVRGTAFRVLTEWSGIEAAPDLLRLAQNGDNPTWGVLAFRGYVRLCREGQAPPAEKHGMLAEAMKFARSPEQKRLVISALGELHDPETLSLLDPCLADPDLVEETCLAIVQLARSSDPKDKDQISPVLQRVLRLSQNPELRREARKALERLGSKQ